MTGSTVVEIGIVEVTTVVEPAGQLVTVGAQLVMVTSLVVYTVEVVSRTGVLEAGVVVGAGVVVNPGVDWNTGAAPEDGNDEVIPVSVTVCTVVETGNVEITTVVE